MSQLADDCEAVLRLLLDAPATGLTQDELAKSTGWSGRTVNEVLCVLRPKLDVARVRSDRGRTVTKYAIKNRGSR